MRPNQSQRCDPAFSAVTPISEEVTPKASELCIIGVLLHVRTSSHRSVSACRRKLYFAPLFFLSNSKRVGFEFVFLLHLLCKADTQFVRKLVLDASFRTFLLSFFFGTCPISSVWLLWLILASGDIFCTGSVSTPNIPTGTQSVSGPKLTSFHSPWVHLFLQARQYSLSL